MLTVEIRSPGLSIGTSISLRSPSASSVQLSVPSFALLPSTLEVRPHSVFHFTIMLRNGSTRNHTAAPRWRTRSGSIIGYIPLRCVVQEPVAVSSK